MNRNFNTSILSLVSDVYDRLGSGRPEHDYEEALAQAFSDSGFSVCRQNHVSARSYDIQQARNVSLYLVIDEQVILELKSVEEYSKLFERQLLTYLQLTGCKMGYVINFKTDNLPESIHTVYNRRSA